MNFELTKFKIMKIMKKQIITLVLTLVLTQVYSRPILEKNVEDCRTNLWGQVKCGHVKQNLVSYPCPTPADPDRTCNGWTLDCKGSGSTSCEIDHGTAVGGSISDQVDQYWSDYLEAYAHRAIESENNLIGTHSKVVLMPDLSIRIYTLTWNWVFDVNGNVSGSIKISCNV
jgi:hypothetical protein